MLTFQICYKIDWTSSNLKKFLSIEMFGFSLFSNHNAIKLEISNKTITRKSPDVWKLRNKLIHKKGIIMEIRK